MQNIAEIYHHKNIGQYLGPARIVDIHKDRTDVKIVIHTPEGKRYAEAQAVYPIAENIHVGDTVLVTGSQDNALYIIGLLDQSLTDTVHPQKITVKDGTSACIEKDDNGQTLCVYSNTNKLIFRYDPRTGQASIVSPGQNLVLQAPEGDIELNAAKRIRVSGHSVDITGKSNISMSVGQIFENLRSAFSLKPGQIDIAGHQIQVSAKQGRLFFNDIRNHVKNLVNKIGQARVVADRLETTAGTIIENAEDTYRSAENLSQVRAGRMRTLIRSTFHLSSKTSIIKASDDVKVKGENIHLG